MTAQVERARRGRAAARALAVRAMAVVGAVLGAVAVWLLAVYGFGVELVAPAGGPGSTELEEVGLPAVVGVALGSSLAGWALLAVLERILRRGRTVWTVVAGLVLLLSLGAPLGGEGLPASSRVTLLALHLVVGGVLLAVLPRTSPAR